MPKPKPILSVRTRILAVLFLLLPVANCYWSGHTRPAPRGPHPSRPTPWNAGPPVGPATNANRPPRRFVVLNKTYRPRQPKVQGTGMSVFASAPVGVGEHFLGIPLDAHFRPYQGPMGATLFAPGQPIRTPQHKVEHDIYRGASQLELEANFSGWGVSAQAGNTESTRYASYRAMQIDEAVEVNDRTPMRPPPSDAVYYLWRVYLGHTFEMVFSAHESVFTARVAAALLGASGSLSAFASKNSLIWKMTGRGLVPRTGDAIFARDETGIMQSYTTEGAAVPIFVEYRTIPGRRPPDDRAIPWEDSQRSPLAGSCQNDLACGTHRCDRSVGRCAFPCVNTAQDCASGMVCNSDICVPP